MARKNTITRFLEDIVDDTKDFADDLLDRAKDLEVDLRDAVKDAIDDDDTSTSTGSKAEVRELQIALAELTAKVDRLVDLQLVAATPAVPAAPAGKPAVSTTV